MRLSDNDIKIIADFFTGKPVLKAYLFGAHSRNEAGSKCNVDLDYSKHIELGFVQMKMDLEKN
jgi:hypothetical protein